MRRFLALSFVQRGLMLAVYVAATMVLARLLTPEQVGIFSMTAAFVGVAAAIREFGMTEFLIQERELTDERIRSAYGVAIAIGWTVGLVVFLCAPLLAAAYNEPLVKQIVYVLCLNFLILPFATPSMALLVREMDLARAWGVQSAAIVAQYAVSIALAWQGAGPISLAWGSVASSVCSVLLLLLLRPAELRMLPALKNAGAAWRYGSKFALTSSLEVAAKNVHEFIIPSAFGFAALGLYSRAAGLFEQFNQNFTRAISRVLLPTIAQEARSGTAIAGRYGHALALFSCVAWAFFGFAAANADAIVLVLFGSQWTAAASLLQLMCLAGVIQGGYAFAADVLAAMGQIGARLRIIGVTTPAWVVLCLLGSLASVEAIALLSAGTALIAFILYSRRLKSLIGFTTKDFFRQTVKSAMVAVASTAVAFVFGGAVEHWIKAPAASLGLTALASACAWLLAVYGLRHPLADEITKALTRFANRGTRAS